MSVLEAIILAIVEGITEYLPISSTGHMVLVNALMGIEHDPYAKLYIVVIQFGAILSVVFLYWRRFLNFQNRAVLIDFYAKLLVALIPALLAGALLHEYIDELLANVLVVALALFIGGIVLLFIERIFPDHPKEEKPISWRMALAIGMFQIFALIPGVSRSAAVIIGALSQGLNRKQAAEFSFFLAVPTLFAASVFDLRDNLHLMNQHNIALLVLGSLISLVVAMAAIKSFISYLSHHSLRLFGWYRIALGGLIVVLCAMGVSLKVV